MSTPMFGPHHYVDLVISTLEREHLTVEEASYVLMIALRAMLSAEHKTPDEIDDAMLDLASMLHEAEAESFATRTLN